MISTLYKNFTCTCMLTLLYEGPMNFIICQVTYLKSKQIFAFCIEIYTFYDHNHTLLAP